MASLKYKNARNVLPPALLREIQKHANNLYLWIPSTSAVQTAERNAVILEQWKAGVPRKVLAKRFFLCLSSIHKIVQEYNLRQRYPS